MNYIICISLKDYGKRFTVINRFMHITKAMFHVYLNRNVMTATPDERPCFY